MIKLVKLVVTGVYIDTFNSKGFKWIRLSPDFSLPHQKIQHEKKAGSLNFLNTESAIGKIDRSQNVSMISSRLECGCVAIQKGIPAGRSTIYVILACVLYLVVTHWPWLGWITPFLFASRLADPIFLSPDDYSTTGRDTVVAVCVTKH